MPTQLQCERLEAVLRHSRLARVAAAAREAGCSVAGVLKSYPDGYAHISTTLIEINGQVCRVHLLGGRRFCARVSAKSMRVAGHQIFERSGKDDFVIIPSRLLLERITGDLLETCFVIHDTGRRTGFWKPYLNRWPEYVSRAF